MKKYLLYYIPIITMFPAIIIGAIAMHLNNISPSIYIQNILYFVILGLCSYFLLKKKFDFFERKLITVIIICIITCIITSLLTFIDSGIEGVHRWISVGPINLYISVIVLPIIIINLWSLLKNGNLTITILSIICVSIILTLQPDASIMTAFSVTSIILLWDKIKPLSLMLLIVFLSSLSITTWVFLDKLAPVEYVEGIFKLVSDMGIIWSILGVISFIIMIIPFLIFPPTKSKRLSICFGIYYIVILISTVFGNFPIPLMGYGVSPIIGYFISIMWFTKTKINSLN